MRRRRHKNTVRAERSRSTCCGRGAWSTCFDFAQHERGKTGETGFTLIEALVALAIVAIAAAGLIGATERHIDTVSGIERRTTARWIAENRLAELALAGEGPPSGGGQIEMLGQQWQIAETARPSADPDLRLVEVAVAPAGGQPLVRLRGFVDSGAPR
ncbi:type II secretion system minor pseudopilin GspI [Sphingomonas sp. AP4-R1]|uniref:type II secretion system minor pseudopilin GspI n=1 Tax=Sphingomonas sp. AP4-R1 TaxID=2735134 RepID=UPI00149337F0|nr:type II secretion system minor pseudopilin GspI [Sphingomonas sp. AP4-R1]QJU57668.1 type II secretion system minor pseudopilin GspI [Sphingomonas sp. AP4-R1]